jgi:ATP-dependent DNA ligase
MLREPASCWIPERSKKLLKVKNLNDDEGTVVGYITGRETDKGSKLLGLMGALILDYNGKRLELSGFTESERRLSLIKDYCAAETEDTPQGWAAKNPEKEVPAWIEAKEFPRGSKVTFKYRGLTADGIPAEARYWRHKESE